MFPKKPVFFDLGKAAQMRYFNLEDEQDRRRGDQEAINAASFHQEILTVKKRLRHEQGLKQILGQSPPIQELKEKILKVAECDVNVLITGESGSGKELAARAIHYLGSRSGQPFIPINCGAIPEALFENELFGHAQGAYTDARFRQVGLLKEAEGGTVFLDEIGAISPYVQVKLLRLLQDKEYKPLGDTKPQKAKVRIIVATNKDLQSLVKNGTFREDLYYRLNVVLLFVPPLRDRREDIPLLVEHYISKYAREYHKPALEICFEALQTFLLYSWPGNVRELENKIQELVVMSSSPTIQMENVLSSLESQSAAKEKKTEPFKDAKKKAVEAFENAYLTQLLREVRGDVAQAAICAGKNRTALWNLLKKRAIPPAQFR